VGLVRVEPPVCICCSSDRSQSGFVHCFGLFTGGTRLFTVNVDTVVNVVVSSDFVYSALGKTSKLYLKHCMCCMKNTSGGMF